ARISRSGRNNAFNPLENRLRTPEAPPGKYRCLPARLVRQRNVRGRSGDSRARSRESETSNTAEAENQNNQRAEITWGHKCLLDENNKLTGQWRTVVVEPRSEPATVCDVLLCASRDCRQRSFCYARSRLRWIGPLSVGPETSPPAGPAKEPLALTASRQLSARPPDAPTRFPI